MFARAILVRIAALVCAATVAFAQTPASPDAEFQKTFKSIHDQMAAGKYKEALPRLKKLVDDHRADGVAVANRDRIVDDWRRCAFRIAFPAPEVKALLKGELLSWDAASGRIKIREKNAESDLVDQSGLRLFPAAFAGPHTIEIKGKSWAMEPVGISAVCLGESSGFRIVWGYPQPTNKNGDTRWIPARVEERAGENWKEVDKNEKPPCVGGKAFTLKIDVSERLINASYNGVPYLHAKKGAAVWGVFGFGGMDVTEVLIEGKIEKSWIENMVDAASQKDLKSFAWEPEKELPEWLVSGAAPSDKVAAASVMDELNALGVAPGLKDERQTGRAQALMQRAEEGEAKEVLKRLATTSDDELSESTRHFIAAVCHDVLGAAAEAERALARVIELEPSYVPASLVLAQTQEDAGRTKDAIATLEAAVKRTPKSFLPYAALLNLNLQRGDRTAARAVIDRARQALPGHPLIARAGATLAKAENGPNFAKTFESKTNHFVVVSDIDRETCAKAAALLEDALMIYGNRIRAVPAGAGLFRVFLFSGRAGYEAYLKDMELRMPIHTAGLYSPQLKQLLIWNLPEREDMMRTVRHEGFHQYLDAVLPVEPPRWFNEGLAVYHEYAKVVNGTWTTGLTDLPELDRAKRAIEGVFSLETFVYDSPKGFYSHAEANYPLAWAFITFLRNTTTERKKLFDEFFNALATGGSPTAAVEKSFPRDGLAAMEREFKEWLLAQKR